MNIVNMPTAEIYIEKKFYWVTVASVKAALHRLQFRGTYSYDAVLDLALKFNDLDHSTKANKSNKSI